MGRKKNIQKENMPREKKTRGGSEENKVDSKFDFSLSADVKRNTAGVILFALAVLFILGFFGYAGTVGDFLNKASGKAIGWAKLIFPLFLIASGVVLLFKKQTLFYVTKIIGLVFAFISIAGFMHWFFPLANMQKMAELGRGGGYLGYTVAYTLIKYLGNAGSLVIILTLFFVGIIVAFEFSFVHFFGRFKKAKEDDVIDAEGEKSDADAIPAVVNNLENIEPKLERPADSEEVINADADALAEENIGKIKFVEGRDQFVDPDLEDDAEFEDDLFSQKELPAKKTNFSRKKNNRQWKFPPLDILDKTTGKARGGDVEKNAEIIEKTLRNFGIEVERGEIKTGPAVTQYSFRPAVGVKIAKILSLQNDLSLALANPIRIEAPIQGKSLFGIEVPNRDSSLVILRKILESAEFKARKSNLTIAIGEDVSGNYIFDCLDRMPHLLVAGATNTGKSVCINSIITSLLYQNSPEDLKFIMVDPKRVELSLYNGIPHLLTDVIVDNAKVVNALKWALSEMDKRYKLFQEIGVRDISSYNEKLRNGETRTLTDAETGEISEVDLKKLPYVAIIIDELADLMGSHGKEVEGVIVRIAQMARAVGIHLILSTQRPEVKVITGLIKANITTRIALQVATQIDSRTILDMAGAEKLLGKGDLLYASTKSPKPKRIQGVYVTEKEVKDIVKFIKTENPKDEEEDDELEEAVSNSVSNATQELNGTGSFNDDQGDELYEIAKKEIMQSKKASASFLQRRLRVGYARAARLLDILEDKGVVGPADGAKPREIYGLPEQEQTVYNEAEVDQEKRDKWEL